MYFNRPSNKVIIIIVSVLVVIIAGCFIYQQFFAGEKAKELGFFTWGKSEIKEGEYEHTDSSMGSLVSQDQELKEYERYYEFNGVKRGDLVVVDLEGRSDFIRRVIAVPGDELGFDGANLKIKTFINWEMVENAEGEFYPFPDTIREALSGKVPNNSFLVLSESTKPSAFDSRQFGFVTREQLKSKLIP